MFISLNVQAREVVDDGGHTIRLDRTAKRIVSLAPHITELLFAAGAGKSIVGVTAYSDFPPQAAELPQIGNYDNVDVEAILRLRPDLVIAWQTGNKQVQIDVLRRLGLTVFVSEPRSLEDIDSTLRRFGRLAGTTRQADVAANHYTQRLAQLRRQYRNVAVIRAFYQLWHEPLITINGQHIISDAMKLCGLQNIFSDLPALAPQVSHEAVLFKDPQFIVASGANESPPEWLDDWHKWPELTAVKAGNLFAINPDIIQRHTPRIVEGIEQLCRQADEARGNLKRFHGD